MLHVCHAPRVVEVLAFYQLVFGGKASFQLYNRSAHAPLSPKPKLSACHAPRSGAVLAYSQLVVGATPHSFHELPDVAQTGGRMAAFSQRGVGDRATVMSIVLRCSKGVVLPFGAAGMCSRDATTTLARWWKGVCGFECVADMVHVARASGKQRRVCDSGCAAGIGQVAMASGEKRKGCAARGVLQG